MMEPSPRTVWSLAKLWVRVHACTSHTRTEVSGRFAPEEVAVDRCRGIRGPSEAARAAVGPRTPANLTRRCSRTRASVAAFPLAPAAERQYRYPDKTCSAS